MPRPSEDSLIARYFAPLAGEGALGLRDDAAVLGPRSGHDLVITADALVAGVHFLSEDPPASIARKALGVNVSDLAAKGADPTGFLLTLALPEDWTEDWLAEFAEGLGRAAQDWRCRLLGGDTVRTGGPVTLSITALGEVPAGRMVLRTTARAGDLVCLTGTVGDATLGLALRAPLGSAAGGDGNWQASLTGDERDHLVDRYLHPQPRIALARILREYARAAMDVSDGLAGDLAKMLRVSGVTAVVDVDRVPLSRAVQAAIQVEPGVVNRVVTGGDDYEILCTVAPERLADFEAETHNAGVPLSAIGHVVEGSGLPTFLVHGTERRFGKGSFSHF